MVISQVDDNWGTLDCILWFYDSWWHYIGIICAWPLIKYIYIHKYMYLYVHDTWWSLAVCVCMCVCLVHNHDTCCLNYSMFFVLTCPHPSRFQFKHDNCVYVCVFGSVIMILVVWITACFFVLACPPLQVSILAWKLIARKWKETCWKTIPKLKRKKITAFFHPKWNYHFQKPNYHNQRTEVNLIHDRPMCLGRMPAEETNSPTCVFDRFCVCRARRCLPGAAGPWKASKARNQRSRSSYQGFRPRQSPAWPKAR